VAESTLSNEMFVRLRKVANEIGEPPEILAERAVRDFLRAEARHRMRREVKTFRAQHAELLARYPNQYVAIYQGRVVDQDAGQLVLLAHVEKQYPDTPVLITLVSSEPEESYTMRSPRWESGL
jgi:predicted transcriptional regulator